MIDSGGNSIGNKWNVAGATGKTENARKPEVKKSIWDTGVKDDSVSLGSFVPGKDTAIGKKVSQYLKIVSTNDIHGHMDPFLDKVTNKEVGGIANLGAAIKREKAEDPEHTILLDAGDVADGGAVSDYFSGLPLVEAMNQIGYDAMTAGNHDVNQGVDGFRNIVQTADFPVLSANLLEKAGEGEKIPIKPYVILEPKGVDVKVGVLGLTTPDTESMLSAENRDRISFLEPAQVARENIAKMKKEGAGLIVLLSHLGLEGDKDLAGKVDGIDVIVGGHSHTELKEPVEVNGTLITQTGSFGQNYGKIEVSFDRSGDGVKIKNVKSTLHRVEPGNVGVDKKIYKVVDKYKRMLKPILNREIGEAPEDLNVRDYHVYKEESALNNYISDALRRKTGSDIFIHSTSALRTSMPKGKVTVGTVHQILPWKNDITIVKMKGKDIKQVLEAQLSGPLHCSAQSGLKMTIDTNAPKWSRLKEVKMEDGKPLEDNKVYTVATEDLFADGSFEMHGFKNAISRKSTGIDIRDMLIEAIEEDGKITSEVDGRMVNMSQMPNEDQPY